MISKLGSVMKIIICDARLDARLDDAQLDARLDDARLTSTRLNYSSVNVSSFTIELNCSLKINVHDDLFHVL